MTRLLITKRALVAAVAVPLAGFALWAQNRPAPQSAPPLPPGTASVSGTVVVLGTNQPIPGASIELRRLDCNSFANPPEVLAATSDSEGKYSFRNIHAGNWCAVATT